MTAGEFRDALRAECQADPKGLGLASLFAQAQDRAVADLLNARTGTGAGPVAAGPVAKGDFLTAIAPGVLRLAGMSATLQGKWDRIIRLLIGAEGVVNCARPNTQAVLSLAVTDGVLTQAEVDAVAKRAGSRAEVLWGADTLITPEQVGAAR